jgi:hypothetical protein
MISLLPTVPTVLLQHGKNDCFLEGVVTSFFLFSLYNGLWYDGVRTAKTTVNCKQKNSRTGKIVNRGG